MTDHQLLAERFDADRTHLRALAYRMLGSVPEADDAVQETWLRLSRSDTSGVENLSGWLRTVTARICLDMLRSRSARREESFGADRLEPSATLESGSDPELEALLGDAVGLALLVVLETLDPPERVAFVLHDLFGVPFDEIAPIVERSPAAARQLASRARRRVRGGSAPEVDPVRQREVVRAFLAASRGGDLRALLAVLDPDVVVRADRAAVAMGAEAEVRGAEAVAATFAGRARAAQPARIDGIPGLVWAQQGKPRVVFGFTIEAERIVRIDMVADPDRLRGLDVVMER
jgi:RNA polymerase sigma-70 factor (ECF subfamily)